MLSDSMKLSELENQLRETRRMLEAEIAKNEKLEEKVIEQRVWAEKKVAQLKEDLKNKDEVPF